jgi:hypothetical protein
MSANYSLRGRVPGQSVMSEIVATQRLVPARSLRSRLFGLSPLNRANRVLYRAALGELLVGDALDHLGTEWDVLHVVPLGRDDREIDHLAIGPPGVFTISSRDFSGQDVWVGGETLLVGGHHLGDIATAKDEARIAAALLGDAAGRPVVIEPIIVAVNPKKLVIREQPSGLVVVSSRQLLRWLTRLDRRLDGEEVAFISDLADHEEIWQPASTPTEDTQQLYRDFARLRAQVVSAARIRLGWGAAAFAVIAVSVWIGVAELVEQLVLS